MNHPIAKKVIIEIIYKRPIQMYKMSLTVYHSLSTSLVKSYFAADEKKISTVFHNDMAQLL